MSNEIDVVYLYPQSSCPCIDCTQKKCVNSKGPKTNLGVNGCNISECLDCYDRVLFNKNIEPVEKKGYSLINPKVYSEKLDPQFGKIPCEQKGCPSPSYMAWDPRLFSTTRADYIPLNSPPITGDVRLKNLMEKKWDNYGWGFKPYSEINDGQIEYYIDKSIEDPYFQPNFVMGSNAFSVLYKDPMGSMKPEYTRVELDQYNPTVKDGPECYFGGLSFIQDSMASREDLISYQMRKRNQERWEPRWAPA